MVDNRGRQSLVNTMLGFSLDGSNRASESIG